MTTSARTLPARPLRLAAVVLGATLLGGVLTACAPLVVGGAAATGVLVATDRRTSATQLEDQTIELRAASRIRDEFGDRTRVLVHSYNRRVLLVGQIPRESDRARVLQVISTVDNVQHIVDELTVENSPNLRERSSDTLVTTRVRAALVDAKDLFANSFKVTTEQGTTYLMGRVTQREADRATEVVRGVPGVLRVVRVFEIITEEELARSVPQQPPPVTSGGNTSR
ncbi:MAG: BON domain-containing protein [Serpentinimonas sp.]|nr:BON domain-containing protein [Serpentinimonas sp.]